MSRDAHPYGEAEGPREDRFIDREARYGVAIGFLMCGALIFGIGILTPYPVVDVGCFALALLTVVLAVRSIRSAVIASEAGILYRGIFWARRYRWDEIESIATEASRPDVDPTRYLVIRLKNGRACHVFELDSNTAQGNEPARLNRIVDRLNAMLETRSSGEEPRDERSR